MDNSYSAKISPAEKLIVKAKRRFIFGRDIPLYAILSPALVLVLVFCYFPMYGVLIAFKDFSPFKGILGSPWVGLQYFKEFLNDSYFWNVMLNTLRINVLSLLFGFPAPIILALLLNEVVFIKFKKIVQTISYLPYFISWVVVASIANTILSPESGVVNILLVKVLHMEPIYFLTESKYFVAIIVLAGIWKGIGMSSIYYLAALSSIDPVLYDAAKIDGAGRLMQTLHITLPGLKNMITVLLVLNLGTMVSIGFENIFLFYNPLVYDVGDVISTYTYRLGLVNMQYSVTTAIGLAQSVINMVLILGSNFIAKKMGGWALW